MKVRGLRWRCCHAYRFCARAISSPPREEQRAGLKSSESKTLPSVFPNATCRSTGAIRLRALNISKRKKKGWLTGFVLLPHKFISLRLTATSEMWIISASAAAELGRCWQHAQPCPSESLSWSCRCQPRKAIPRNSRHSALDVNINPQLKSICLAL